MKFIKEEPPKNEGHTRYLFAIGKQEAAILLALLMKAIHYMPRTLRTKPTEARIRNMWSEIYGAIPDMKEDKDYDLEI